MDHPQRKSTRLKGFDYNSPGYYFITLCTKRKEKLLCDIVGTGVLDGPKTQFTHYGKIALSHLEEMKDFYEDIKIDKYVVMPNHIHLILRILAMPCVQKSQTDPANTKTARFIGTFKRLCNRDFGESIWQFRSHDHIIRGEKDYQKIWNYIDNNPAKWADDCFYCD